MSERELICIGCPMGCPIVVKMEDGKVVSVTGNTCPRGEAYARKEVTDPTRIVTTTVRVADGKVPMINVKTEHDIPKDKIFDCIAALRGVTIKAPVHIGDIVLENVAGRSALQPLRSVHYRYLLRWRKYLSQYPSALP